MYAIVNISGKQFKAIEGDRIRVPKQNGEEGTELIFNNVHLFHNGKQAKTGNPTIPGVSVTATILDHCRDKKILVYKKKRRKGYQRKNGHRQWYTNIEFQKINTTVDKNLSSNKPTDSSLEGNQEEE